MTKPMEMPSATTLARTTRGLSATSQAAGFEQKRLTRLGQSQTFEQAAPDWLALQSDMIDGTVLAVVVRVSETGERLGVAVWPEGTKDVTPLSSAVDQALSKGRGIVQGAEGSGEKGTAGRMVGLAYPLILDDVPHGAVAFLLQEPAEIAVRHAMRMLQWGTAGLRELILRESVIETKASAERTASAVELLATALEEEHFAAACRALVTEIAIRMDCDRVSIGFRRQGVTKVEAISHSAQFGKRMNLVRMLGLAMDEAVDQQAVIVYPPEPTEPNITRAHEELSRSHSSKHILTAPMFVHDEFFGAVTFERATDAPFDAHEIAYLESVSVVIGPVLRDKKLNDRWLVVKAWDAIVEQARRLLGPGYFKRKVAVIGVLALTVFFTLATGQYRISADAVVEGSVQRSIVVPFDGFIQEAPVRAGDEVFEGDLIAALDDRELVLERLRWVTERQKSFFEYERALGERNRTESRIVQTLIDNADAQIELIDEQINRTRMEAPFDGVIVSGDLSQSIGSSVQRGEVLFQLAPLGSYRVILNVDESQISDIAPGSQGRLRVASLPDEAFAIEIDKITPVAVAAEGKNFFRVEATLEEGIERLLPGMNGVGLVDVDERRLIWIWTRTMMDWMQVQFWRWFG